MHGSRSRMRLRRKQQRRRRRGSSCSSEGSGMPTWVGLHRLMMGRCGSANCAWITHMNKHIDCTINGMHAVVSFLRSCLPHYSMICCLADAPGAETGFTHYATVHSWIFSAMVRLASEEIYSSISSSSLPLACPFCREFDLGTEASLSIICRETDTMLSSMSCWPTSSMSTR